MAICVLVGTIYVHSNQYFHYVKVELAPKLSLSSLPCISRYWQYSNKIHFMVARIRTETSKHIRKNLILFWYIYFLVRLYLLCCITYVMCISTLQSYMSNNVSLTVKKNYAIFCVTFHGLISKNLLSLDQCNI